MIYKFILFIFFNAFVGLFAQTASAEIRDINLPLKQVNAFVNAQVKDDYPYAGLASFYNGINVFVVDQQSIQRVESQTVKLTENQWLAIVGHYKVFVFQSPDLAVAFNEDDLTWSSSEQKIDIDQHNIKGQLLAKSELNSLDPALTKLKYAHLWAPFRILCLGIEGIASWLNSIHSFGWGISIVLLSILFKIFILPANMLLVRAQRKVSYTQAKLAPELAKIKANYSGEEAHTKFMSAHKNNNVTPFYTLKPLPLALLPFPFLIAIFNVLGEMDQLTGHSFLWINDLTKPDAIYNIGFHIPLLGGTINLLPILMTLLTIVGALLHRNKIVTQKELWKQKLNLYFMAFGFFVLFYSFPAAMVFYWTLANVWQLIQQKFIRI